MFFLRRMKGGYMAASRQRFSLEAAGQPIAAQGGNTSFLCYFVLKI
jgi:hypothetical protein